MELGLGDGAISHRLRTGRLYLVYPGVYAVGHPRGGTLDRAAAAVLACGPGAVLSHSSAAALWGFTRSWREPFEVTVPGDRRPKRIRTHRSRVLVTSDKRRRFGIPVTSPARTVLDCTPQLTDARLARLIGDAIRSEHLDRPALRELLARCGHHPGAGRLRGYARQRGRPTRSEFEDVFTSFVDRFGLPQPEINTFVTGREVDAFFRAEGVIVELDGYAFHSGRAEFERDRNQDADALAAGLVTVRITWERLTERASMEATRLRAILGKRRGGRGGG